MAAFGAHAIPAVEYQRVAGIRHRSSDVYNRDESYNLLLELCMQVSILFV
jgi:hypothetical protein